MDAASRFRGDLRGAMRGFPSAWRARAGMSALQMLTSRKLRGFGHIREDAPGCGNRPSRDLAKRRPFCATKGGAAVAESEGLKSQKQTHFVEGSCGFFPFAGDNCDAQSRAAGGRVAGTPTEEVTASKVQKQTHLFKENPAFLGDRAGQLSSVSQRSSDRTKNDGKIAKTNPLNPAFTGNRLQRRRAAAMARKQV